MSFSTYASFYEDKNKKIWIGTHAGVFVIDLASKKVIHHDDTSNSQLLENFVRSIAQDSEGRFWIGTFGGGVGIYTPDMQLGQEFTNTKVFVPIRLIRYTEAAKPDVACHR